MFKLSRFIVILIIFCSVTISCNKEDKTKGSRKKTNITNDNKQNKANNQEKINSDKQTSDLPLLLPPVPSVTYNTNININNYCAPTGQNNDGVLHQFESKIIQIDKSLTANSTASAQCINAEREYNAKNIQVKCTSDGSISIVSDQSICSDFESVDFPCSLFFEGSSIIVNRINLTRFQYDDNGIAKTFAFDLTPNRSSNNIIGLGNLNDGSLLENPLAMAYKTCEQAGAIGMHTHSDTKCLYSSTNHPDCYGEFDISEFYGPGKWHQAYQGTWKGTVPGYQGDLKFPEEDTSNPTWDAVFEIWPTTPFSVPSNHPDISFEKSIAFLKPQINGDHDVFFDDVIDITTFKLKTLHGLDTVDSNINTNKTYRMEQAILYDKAVDEQVKIKVYYENNTAYIYHDFSVILNYAGYGFRPFIPVLTSINDSSKPINRYCPGGCKNLTITSQQKCNSMISGGVRPSSTQFIMYDLASNPSANEHNVINEVHCYPKRMKIKTFFNHTQSSLFYINGYDSVKFHDLVIEAWGGSLKSEIFTYKKLLDNISKNKWPEACYDIYGDTEISSLTDADAKTYITKCKNFLSHRFFQEYVFTYNEDVNTQGGYTFPYNKLGFFGTLWYPDFVKSGVGLTKKGYLIVDRSKISVSSDDTDRYKVEYDWNSDTEFNDQEIESPYLLWQLGGYLSKFYLNIFEEIPNNNGSLGGETRVYCDHKKDEVPIYASSGNISTDTVSDNYEDINNSWKPSLILNDGAAWKMSELYFLHKHCSDSFYTSILGILGDYNYKDQKNKFKIGDKIRNWKRVFDLNANKKVTFSNLKFRGAGTYSIIDSSANYQQLHGVQLQGISALELMQNHVPLLDKDIGLSYLIYVKKGYGSNSSLRTELENYHPVYEENPNTYLENTTVPKCENGNYDNEFTNQEGITTLTKNDPSDDSKILTCGMENSGKNTFNTSKYTSLSKFTWSTNLIKMRNGNQIKLDKQIGALEVGGFDILKYFPLRHNLCRSIDGTSINERSDSTENICNSEYNYVQNTDTDPEINHNDISDKIYFSPFHITNWGPEKQALNPDGTYKSGVSTGVDGNYSHWTKKNYLAQAPRERGLCHFRESTGVVEVGEDCTNKFSETNNYCFTGIIHCTSDSDCNGDSYCDNNSDMMAGGICKSPACDQQNVVVVNTTFKDFSLFPSYNFQNYSISGTNNDGLVIGEVTSLVFNSAGGSWMNDGLFDYNFRQTGMREESFLNRKARIERNIFNHSETNKTTGEGIVENTWVYANNLYHNISYGGGYFNFARAFWINNSYLNPESFSDFEKNPAFEWSEPNGYRATFMKNASFSKVNVNDGYFGLTLLENIGVRVKRPSVDYAFNHNLFLGAHKKLVRISTPDRLERLSFDGDRVVGFYDNDTNAYVKNGLGLDDNENHNLYTEAGGVCLDSYILHGHYIGPDGSGNCDSSNTDTDPLYNSGVLGGFYFNNKTDFENQGKPIVHGQRYLDENVTLIGQKVDNFNILYLTPGEESVNTSSYVDEVNRDLFDDRIGFITSHCYFDRDVNNNLLNNIEKRKSPNTTSYPNGLFGDEQKNERVNDVGDYHDYYKYAYSGIWANTYRCITGDPESRFPAAYELEYTNLIQAIDSWIWNIKIDMGDYSRSTLINYINIFDPFVNASEIPANDGSSISIDKCDGGHTVKQYFIGNDSNLGISNLVPANQVGSAEFVIQRDFHGSYRRVNTVSGAFGLGNGQNSIGCRTNSEYTTTP
jgi:hypothetical protein